MATVSELITERQKSLSRDWQSFLKHRHRSVANVAKRTWARLAPDFVPWAPAIVIASDYLLQSVGHTPTSGRPKGWRLQPSTGNYKCGFELIVRKRGQYWTVEGNGLYQCVLVFNFGSMPVCTRTPEAAMRLAEYFADNTRPLPHGLRWIRSTPDGILD